MPFWDKVGKSILYAHDGYSMLSAKTMEELNQKSERLADLDLTGSHRLNLSSRG